MVWSRKREMILAFFPFLLFGRNTSGDKSRQGFSPFSGEMQFPGIEIAGNFRINGCSAYLIAVNDEKHFLSHILEGLFTQRANNISYFQF